MTLLDHSEKRSLAWDERRNDAEEEEIIAFVQVKDKNLRFSNFLSSKIKNLKTLDFYFLLVQKLLFLLPQHHFFSHPIPNESYYLFFLSMISSPMLETFFTMI